MMAMDATVDFFLIDKGVLLAKKGYAVSSEDENRTGIVVERSQQPLIHSSVP